MLFELNSSYSPTGDQPIAIKQILDGFKSGKKYINIIMSDMNW
ncbi:hypothetical protein [Candidatus Vampirococcus lugosii]|uniref:Uncharacterized protein n=1 Tax=Candidatus Vampirococcus lugosii TaxID=2789015 RepID=A0ABS5QMU8_9BACT|nr:hypothetical protein [Candidatus Vampirococcus lugosii]MBS8121804.1 hypothetical protein [Candidatus Vampirococcus lugosii]